MREPAKSRQSLSVAPVRLVLAAAVVVAAAGCAGARGEIATRLDDPQLALELRANIAQVRPHAFHAVHRVILSVHGREFVLSGYVRESADGALRLRADADMGGVLFDIEMPPAGPARIVNNPGPMRDSWLLRGAARDLGVMYRVEPSPGAALVRFAGGEIGFTDQAPGGARREFRFNPASRCFARYTVVNYRRTVCDARFSDLRAVAGFAAPQPRRMSVTDSQLGYTLDLRVLEMRAADGG